jgi:hypothetical protein
MYSEFFSESGIVLDESNLYVTQVKKKGEEGFFRKKKSVFTEWKPATLQ